MEEEHRVHQVPLVSLDLQEESDLQAQLVHLENPDPLGLQEKRDLLVFVETMDPLEDKESEVQLDHLAAQETKGTLERTDPRVLMVLRAQLEPQGREALWVSLVREESEGCRVFQDQRVHQGNKAPQEHLEIKVPQARLVFPVLTGLVVIQVLMAPRGPMVHQARTAFLDKEEAEEILVQRV